MTPGRLVQLECPTCHQAHWQLDHDVRGIGGPYVSYEERIYRCRRCSRQGTGHVVRQKSPPEFLLQPHYMYPMSPKEFERWVRVLRWHFPDHPRLLHYGDTWHAAGTGGLSIADSLLARVSWLVW